MGRGGSDVAAGIQVVQRVVHVTESVLHGLGVLRHSLLLAGVGGGYHGINGTGAEDRLGQVANEAPEQRGPVEQIGHVFGLLAQTGGEADFGEIGCARLSDIGVRGDQVLLGADQIRAAGQYLRRQIGGQNSGQILALYPLGQRAQQRSPCQQGFEDFAWLAAQQHGQGRLGIAAVLPGLLQYRLMAGGFGFGLAQIQRTDNTPFKAALLQAQVFLACGHGLLGQLGLRIQRTQGKVTLRHIGIQRGQHHAPAGGLGQQSGFGSLVGAGVTAPEIDLVTRRQAPLRVTGIRTRRRTEAGGVFAAPSARGPGVQIDRGVKVGLVLAQCGACLADAGTGQGQVVAVSCRFSQQGIQHRVLKRLPPVQPVNAGCTAAAGQRGGQFQNGALVFGALGQGTTGRQGGDRNQGQRESTK